MTIEVTQEDRNRAKEVWRILGPWRMGSADEVEQAFARHRQAAYERGVLDGAMQAVREMRK